MSADTNPSAELRRLKPVELRQITFERALRGYDMHDVDKHVGKLHAEFEQLWRYCFETELALRDACGDIARYEAERDVMLAEVQLAVEEMERAAVNEAARVRDDATREATALREEAARDAANVRAEAEHEAGTRLREMREHLASLERTWEERLAHTRREVDAASTQLQEITTLTNEMRAGYRAFLAAGLELLERHDQPQRPDGGDAGARSAENGADGNGAASPASVEHPAGENGAASPAYVEHPAGENGAASPASVRTDG
jgi:DivIVA domain-containing protein